MKILALADKKSDIPITTLVEQHQPDIIVTLGDFERSDLLELASLNHLPKIGVYGNHCSGTYMPELGITDMHMKTATIDDYTFGGFEGCVRYKENPQAIMYTQQEASAMLSGFPPVDIFICHCPPRGINDEDELSHQGFDGLRDYIERHPPKLLMHGHTYSSEESLVTQHGPTMIKYVFKWQLISL